MHKTTTMKNQSAVLFFDAFTEKSVAEKKQLYRQYRKSGSDLYELKLWAEVCFQVPGMAYDTFETRLYTFVFATFKACFDFAENLRIVPPTVLRTLLPSINGYESEARCQNMQIVQVHPTEQGEELLLGIYGLATSKTLVWINHEDPSELGGLAA